MRIFKTKKVPRFNISAMATEPVFMMVSFIVENVVILITK
jgi:hypothetical protein